jgi:hypothetical protein
MELKETWCDDEEWINMTEDSVLWRAHVNMAMDTIILYNRCVIS